MSHLTTETQLEGVQQQILDVSRALSNLEASLAAAEQAGNAFKVEFLYKKEVALRQEKVALREQETILLQAQQAGGYCSLLPSLASLLAGGHSAGLHYTSLEIAHRKCLMVATTHL